MSGRDSFTPDQVSAENDLISEKLLGWKRTTRGTASAWLLPSGLWRYSSPSFTTWAEAGLILDAADRKALSVETGNLAAEWYCQLEGETSLATNGPLSVRAAALKYVRSLP